MIPSDPLQPWSRLSKAARQASDGRDSAAPHGFATRVAALAVAVEGARFGALLERFALRAVAVAGMLALVSVAVNYPVLQSVAGSSVVSAPEDELVPTDDAVAVALDYTD